MVNTFFVIASPTPNSYPMNAKTYLSIYPCLYGDVDMLNTRQQDRSVFQESFGNARQHEEAYLARMIAW